ncbi:5072_t:CDS:2 [Funneliformis caledonium]|uniref:5072_t:CDS:1 n=1 Tax=Funneliformis caledonium TaxID=1117310 RepID=A0A9N8VT49_9GLOM|nr:5072_t:CDS:2 [Funneliformis caledonium]
MKTKSNEYSDVLDSIDDQKYANTDEPPYLLDEKQKQKNTDSDSNYTPSTSCKSDDTYVEEKHLKRYLSLTTNQKNLLTSITIQDHQEKEYEQQSQYIADKDIADRDIADEDIANRDIADKDIADRDIANKNIVGRDITDRDPIMDIRQNSTSSFSLSQTSILTIPIVHLVNDDATTGMLTDLVNETKILFLRTRDPSHSAQLQLVMAYSENYIHNNSITLDNIPTIENLKLYVDETCIYQCFKTSMIQIYMNNILKCSIDPHLSNASALNEVKSLDYITSQRSKASS